MEEVFSVVLETDEFESQPGSQAYSDFGLLSHWGFH